MFFSGGTALRALSRVLKQFTHNSVHVITAFDSGGSSAQLRKAFGMPALGDLRNRIMALADENVSDSAQIYRLFSYRLPSAAASGALRGELAALASGQHVLAGELTEPMRRIIRAHLAFFVEAMPSGFDLRGANIGNLLLAAGYLLQRRDLDSTLQLFSRLLEVRGLVCPVFDGDLHLCAELDDATLVIGQHRLTGKEVAPIQAPVRSLRLVRGLDDPAPAAAGIRDELRRNIEGADLICYPMGSFYSSVVANLLPAGVGSAIAAARCPKVYVPNTGQDPEQRGMSVATSVSTLHEHARADAGHEVPLSRVVDVVLVDRDASHYAMPVDIARLDRLGVRVVAWPLVDDASRPYLHPQRLAEALLSLSHGTGHG